MSHLYTPRKPSAHTRRALLVLPIDRSGGAERVLSTLAKALSLKGEWEVEIAVLGDRTAPSFVARESESLSVSYGLGGGYAGTEWLLLPRLGRTVYDLVYSTHTRISAFLSLARHLGFLRCRRLVARESTVLADRYSGQRLSAYRALYRAYGAEDLIIAQTSHMAESLAPLLPKAARERVRVIANPVDMKSIQAAASAPVPRQLADQLVKRPYVVWCGRLVDIKQPLLAIETLHVLHRTHQKKMGLLMIGSGPLEGKVRARAEALGLTEYLHLSGQLENPFPLFRECTHGLLTSHREGFPNVLLEMLACGLNQIVTTPCCGDLDMLPNVSVSPPTPEDLASKLAEASPSITSDAQLRRFNLDAFVSAVVGDIDHQVLLRGDATELIA